MLLVQTSFTTSIYNKFIQPRKTVYFSSLYDTRIIRTLILLYPT